MSGPAAPQADPSMIGGVSKAPFVLLPDPRLLFARRAERFDALAALTGNALFPYLRFLSALTRIQAAIAAAGPVPEPLPPAQVDRASGHAMPPLDRADLARRPDLLPVLHRLFDAASEIEKPPPAAAALDDVRRAPSLGSLVDNVLADAIPLDALAQHLYVAAGLHVFAAWMAASLDRARLVPIGTGICPVCGGPPIASLVVGAHGAEGARYAACSLCGTLWNEVRIKCLACGSTKGIGYRDVADGEQTATIKAEVCDQCQSWVKILYQTKNPSLEPVADDVGSLGLDILLREAGYRHAGFNPFMLGY